MANNVGVRGSYLHCFSARAPSKRIHERFFLVYELEGCQKAINFLTKYYEVRQMKIKLNGRKQHKS